ncbi:YolD-like family protein [Bacillus chungangensis]|uniref:YolD-like family protein n=1 Tax=Bacillus chungangensis TaxID=587633 RepID=A0ABT9WRP1_9BACI|nr:YolD-like family protein [Bacillus chungangensis]MDQ0175959.1 hypothetical protein [Bacillus chungangensis]
MKKNKLTPGYNLMWESSRIMLPEHVAGLHKLAEEQRKVDKPILDISQIEENENKIHVAMEFSDEVKITFFEVGFISEVHGRIHYLDQIKKEIRVIDREGEIQYIKFEDILAVEILD